MTQADLDAVLGAVENPVRRRIIARLSVEPNYQLQLSRELGLSQQLVAKHLANMEEVGLVSPVMEDSPRGPQRKEYLLRKSVSISVDFAPNLFRARIFSFGAVPQLEDGSEDAKLLGRMNDIMRYPDDASKIGPLAEIISEVDRKLQSMEERRAVMLYLRNVATREAAKASTSLGTRDRKKVLHYLMREQSDNIVDMSASLGLQRQVIGEILEEIEKEFNAPRQK